MFSPNEIKRSIDCDVRHPTDLSVMAGTALGAAEAFGEESWC
jgi:hypothetical protein